MNIENNTPIVVKDIANTLTDRIANFSLTFVDDAGEKVTFKDVTIAGELVRRLVNSRRTEESKIAMVEAILSGSFEIAETSQVDPIQAACEALGLEFIMKKGGKRGSKIRHITAKQGFTTELLSAVLDNVLIPFSGEISGSVSLPGSHGAIAKTLILTFNS